MRKMVKQMRPEENDELNHVLVTWPPHGSIELWYLPERGRSYMNQVQAHFLNLLERDRSYMNQVQAHFFYFDLFSKEVVKFRVKITLRFLEFHFC